MVDRYSVPRKQFQTTPESAADLNVVDTQAKRRASRGVVKEIMAAIQPSGNASIPVISTKAEKEWTGYPNEVLQILVEANLMIES
ncbi:hypothetical protein QYF36_013532 [Acer negundo]|nr:hypothetical protein QYF36_013532 [Acer negundo]